MEMGTILSQRARQLLLCKWGLLLCFVLISSLAPPCSGDGGQVYEAGFEDEGDWGDEMGYQSDPAYEQYAERLQQQLESLRKEHDEIFGRADTNKVLMFASQAAPLIQRAFTLLNLCLVGLVSLTYGFHCAGRGDEWQ